MLFFLLPLVYSLCFWLTLDTWLLRLLFSVAVVTGYWLHAVDYGLYFFYADAQHEWLSAGKNYFSRGQYGRFITLAWQHRREMQHLITHSLLFIVLYVPLAFFVLTSSGAVFGMGLVLGIGLYLIWLLFHTVTLTTTGSAALSVTETTSLKWIMTIGFIVLSLLLLRS